MCGVQCVARFNCLLYHHEEAVIGQSVQKEMDSAFPQWPFAYQSTKDVQLVMLQCVDW